jgi:hypothetical protein
MMMWKTRTDYFSWGQEALGITAMMTLGAILFTLPLAAWAADSGYSIPVTEYSPAGQTTWRGSSTVSSPAQKMSINVPAGNALHIRPIGTPVQQVGDLFSSQLTQPVIANGMVALPAGSMVYGEVIAVNEAANTMTIHFHEVATPTGESIPIQSSASVNRLYGGVQVQTPGIPSSGSILTTRTVQRMTPAKRLVASTAGGALFGGASGVLSGLTIGATTSALSVGSGAIRGLAWGSAYGAGLGLLSGLIANGVFSRRRHQQQMAAQPQGLSITTSSSRHPLTNITTGSLQEIPVAAPVLTDMVIYLEQPVSITR